MPQNKERGRSFKRTFEGSAANRKPARAAAIESIGRMMFIDRMLPDDEEERKRKESKKA